jgi:hypothetical protein
LKHVIVLQFHRDLPVARNRVRLLRTYNPGLEVYGIYGGRERLGAAAGAMLAGPKGAGFEDVYTIRDRNMLWKRTHTDLAVDLWFKHVGRHLRFDAAIFLQWDMLLLAPVAELFAHVPPDAVGLTGLAPLEEIEAGWPWLTYPAYRVEWEELLSAAREDRGYRGTPFACLGPGAVLPRRFLERYAELELPETCHDELRLPLFAQMLGFELVDTRFYRRWHDAEEERIFNADEAEIALDVIARELATPGGRRVFHPYRRVFPSARLGVGSAATATPPSRLDDTLESAASRILAAVRLPYRAWRSVEARGRRRAGREPWPVGAWPGRRRRPDGSYA